MFAIVGGILLVVGAYFVARGEIFKSVIVYFFADMCWLALAIQNHDYIGGSLIVIGASLGLYAYLKMHFGKMERKLKHFKGENND